MGDRPQLVAESATPPPSCIVGSPKSRGALDEKRRDRKGNPITRGTGGHHYLAFADQVHGSKDKLAEINEVPDIYHLQDKPGCCVIS
mmetsp:Transcript_151298/g.263713  ORF Transcript_151298/g.263713 Transcript_151298/m.263713 type:complete len:87 (-) Transcript_151298:104-364(-)